MTKGYYRAAWNDIKNSEGWFGKSCLLGLILFIPVFGIMVVDGYLLGWSREIAWNLNRPLPKKIFGNEDGKLYRRGWFSFVIGLVMSIVPLIIYIIAMAVSGDDSSGLNVGAAILMILCVLATILFEMAAWVGDMRMTLYDSLGAGLGFKQIWKMMDHDFPGLLRIFCIELVLSIIICLIVFVVFFLVFFIAIMSAFGILSGSGDLMTGAGAAELVMIVLTFLPLFLIMMYVMNVATVFVAMVVFRAMGYWTRNFQVDKWGDRNAPLPFETQATQNAAATSDAAAASAAAAGTAVGASAGAAATGGSAAAADAAGAPAAAAQQEPGATEAPSEQSEPAPASADTDSESTPSTPAPDAPTLTVDVEHAQPEAPAESGNPSDQTPDASGSAEDSSAEPKE
ncbi:MAG: DUF4013 domain-containing protein [Eggerthellaceae bacterium]